MNTKERLRKRPASLITLEQLSVSASSNQPTGFFVSGKLTPNRLFQISNELKRLMGYSKRLR